MKLFVVSDIHGHAELLKEALNSAGYDKSNENHLLICCGDCFDRGPENTDVLKFFERIDRKIMIKGNHEERLLEILDTGRLEDHDFMNGTDKTILEFFGKYSIINAYMPIDFSGKTGMINRLYGFIGEMRNYYETDNYIFVHGWLPNEHGVILSDWRNADEKRWSAGRWTWWINGCEMSGNNEKKTVICGHYPTPTSEVYRKNGFIAIDAGTATRQKVNVLVIEDEV